MALVGAGSVINGAYLVLILIFLYIFFSGPRAQRKMTQFEEKERKTLTVSCVRIPCVLIWIPYLFVLVTNLALWAGLV